MSYFIQEGTNRRYERSRWMLVTAVLLLALHYFLQMRFSIRATTDAGATVVNILFYTPAAFLFSGSVLGLEGDRRRFRSYVYLSHTIAVFYRVAEKRLSGDAIRATHNACRVLRGNDRVCACSVEGYKA
uniref:hypothetical protein n=1 Tax=Prevotella sp. TaxID=59823 RepID=UPI0040266B54